jgi:hypothetical protein
MTCDEFVERYSDFADDEALSIDDRAQFEAHLAACRSCLRYHTVLQKGAELIRAAHAPAFRDDFRERLQHRLYLSELESRGGIRPQGGTGRVFIGGGLLAASVLVLLGTWQTLARSFVPTPSIELPPIVASAPPRAALPLDGDALWTRRPGGDRGLQARLPTSELWADSHELLYQHSALHQRSRQGSGQGAVIRTGIQ